MNPAYPFRSFFGRSAASRQSRSSPSPDDIGATVYNALGVDHEADVEDRFGRPVRLNRGTPIEALYTA